MAHDYKRNGASTLLSALNLVFVQVMEEKKMASVLVSGDYEVLEIH